MELLRVTGPLKKKFPDNAADNSQRQRQTSEATHADNRADSEAAPVLQVKLEALQGMLRVKEEMLRMKEEQLQQAKEREQFYQDELRAVRLLAAPLSGDGKQGERKKRKWFFWHF